MKYSFRRCGSIEREESCIRILFSLLKLQNEIWEGKPIASF